MHPSSFPRSSRKRKSILRKTIHDFVENLKDTKTDEVYLFVNPFKVHIAYFGFSESLWRNQKHRCCFFYSVPPGLINQWNQKLKSWFGVCITRKIFKLDCCLKVVPALYHDKYRDREVNHLSYSDHWPVTKPSRFIWEALWLLWFHCKVPLGSTVHNVSVLHRHFAKQRKGIKNAK